MRRVWHVVVILLLALLALFILGPYEELEPDGEFDPEQLEQGVGLYLRSVESAFDDIRPGAEKQVIWAGEPEARTPLAIVYLHGFSASAQEIRPVPDRVAQALGANLVFTRFRGHGRDGDAMAEATASDWMRDAAEALAVGRAVGERVVVIGTSTGGTVAAAALVQEALARDVAGVAFISPNFGIRNAAAPLLTMPAARYWVPLLAGKRRSFEPQNEAHAAHWTTEYPSVAVFPMARIVQHAMALDYAGVKVPALFYYSNEDKVVRPDLTAVVEQAWGGPVTRGTPSLDDGDDPYAHVIAGDIMSPGNTSAAVNALVGWIGGL